MAAEAMYSSAPEPGIQSRMNARLSGFTSIRTRVKPISASTERSSSTGDAPEMQPVRDALDKILSGHDPFPAVVVDRRWNLVSANKPALMLLTDGVAPALLEPPANALRVSLHPDGLAPRIVNFAAWSDHLLTRLDRQVAASADDELRALADELRTYPGVAGRHEGHVDAAALLFVPLVLRTRGEQLHLFSTLATFGTALDITVEELAIEAFFPADAATSVALRELT